MTVKLQGIHGQQKAKAVKELKVGDVIMWNFGYTSTVVELIPSKTGKTITCILKSNQDGIVRDRKMGAERLVAIAQQPAGKEIDMEVEMKQWFEIENGKVWLVDSLTRCMVYGLDTEKPYVRCFNRKWYLEPDQIKEARALLA